MLDLLKSVRAMINEKVDETDGVAKILWTFLLGMFDGLYASALFIGAFVIILGLVIKFTPEPKTDIEKKKEEM